MVQQQQITDFLRSLRAVRRFSSRAIEDEVLFDILDVARWTGSSKNTQPWHLIVVRDRATLTELAACGPYAGHLKGGPAAIVLVRTSRRVNMGASSFAGVRTMPR